MQLRRAGGDAKTSVVLLLAPAPDAGRASRLLMRAGGSVRQALRIARDDA